MIVTTAIAGVAGTGLGGLIGALLQKDSNRTVSLLLSFAGGVMLSVVCFDLITEAIATNIGILTVIAAGNDADSKNGGTKKDHSESGQYNMKAGGAQYDWHEEIAFFEKHVVNKGLESVELKSDGKTDTVSGCTIAVKNYVELIKEAMDKAKK